MPKVWWRYDDVPNIPSGRLGPFAQGTQWFVGGSKAIERTPLRIWADWKARGGDFGIEADLVPLTYSNDFPGIPAGRGSSLMSRTTAYTIPDPRKTGGWPVYTFTTVKNLNIYAVSEFGHRPDILELFEHFPWGFILTSIWPGIGRIKINAVNLDPDGDPSGRTWDTLECVASDVEIPEGITLPTEYEDPRGERVALVDINLGGNAPVSHDYASKRTVNINPPSFIIVPKRYAGDSAGGVGTCDNLLTLYHDTKVNAEIIPQNEYKFQTGSDVVIYAVGRNEKDLLLFEVRGGGLGETVDVLAAVAAGDGVTSEDERALKISDWCYRYTVPAASEDIYVSAVAVIRDVDKDVPEGSSQTVTFTCDDCLTRSYEVVGSSLPSGSSATMATVGLTGELTITVPFGAPHGSDYYVDVKVSGRSQSEIIRVNVTVTAPTFVGTSWAAATATAEIPVAICKDSDDNLYVAAANDKIYKSSDDGATWTECSVSGSITSSGLVDICATDNFVVAITRRDVLVADTGGTTFTVKTALAGPLFALEYYSLTPLPLVDRVYTGMGSSNGWVRVLDIANNVVVRYAQVSSMGLNGWGVGGYALDANTAVFVQAGTGINCIDRTTDQCATSPLTRVESQTAYSNADGDITYDQLTGDLYAVFTRNASSPVAIDLYKSTDDGATWSFVSYRNSPAVERICWSGSTGLSLGGNGSMHYSADSGATWGTAGGDAIAGECKGIVRLSSGKLIAVTNDATTNVYSSTE